MKENLINKRYISKLYDTNECICVVTEGSTNN